MEVPYKKSSEIILKNNLSKLIPIILQINFVWDYLQIVNEIKAISRRKEKISHTMEHVLHGRLFLPLFSIFSFPFLAFKYQMDF